MTNWWGIYGSNGWGGLIVLLFLGDMLKKYWSSGEYPFRSPFCLVLAVSGIKLIVTQVTDTYKW